MAGTLNEQLYQRATKAIAGGVNSPVRAFTNVDLPPLFIKKAKGAHIYDASGKKYIDLLMSWGAIILGHCDEDTRQATIEAVNKASSFGLCHENEIALAELIKNAFDSIELLRMVSSGTEAVMSAIRLARAYTNKEKIIKFQGCYHGHCDDMLVSAGSAMETLSIPASKGLTANILQNTLVAQYNDIESVQKLFEKYAGKIACVIIEPVAGNMGVIAPEQQFLQKIRNLCNQNNALLILDEVITGFRVATGGAQQLYNVRADLTTLGKIIGGGFPCAAFGGKKEIMEMLAPNGNVYQAGTLSGNPVAVAAGKTVIEKLLKLNPYEKLQLNCRRLTDSIARNAEQFNIPVKINRVGTMFTIFFSDNEITTYADLKNLNIDMFKNFFKNSIEAGILIPPSPYESCFLSLEHDAGIIEKIEKKLPKIMNSLN